MSNQSIKVSEIFGPTIQGEGSLIGQPTIFVRTGGCDYRCSWCDTPHAVESKYRGEWTSMSAEDILLKVDQLSGEKPTTISLSGGNPAIQPLDNLIRMGKEKNYRFSLETQGSVSQDWFADLDVLTLSPKPPSSGMETDWDMFDECLKAAGNGPDITLKIVVFDEEDYGYARQAAIKYPELPIYLQPGNDTPPPGDVSQDAIMKRMHWLTERVFEDGWFSAHVLPQLHVMLWGNMRGV